MEGGLGKETESESSKATEMEGGLGKETESESSKGTEMEGGLGKETESESSKGTEMEGGLGKETESESSKATEIPQRDLGEKLEILRKARHDVTRLSKKAKDPATQRALLDNQQQFLSDERRILQMMGKSLTEIQRYPDSDSGDEMGRYSGEHQSLINMEPQLGISKGTVRDSSKEDAGGMEIGQMATDDSVVALSSHLEMLRREISFLRREVTSRGLLPAGKKKACQDQISNLSEEMRTQQVKEVNLPYLGCNKTEEAMDFLLLETQQLLFRFNSLAPTLKTSRIPISPDKVEKLRLISSALVGISELIKSHKSVAQKDNGDCLDRDGWEATWGSRNGRNGGFDDITTLSSMHFTASTPGIFRFPSVVGPALQVYSIKLVDLNPNLSWPLDVYGVVAARDDLDHNRNILFCRSADNCQRIKQEDPFLHLTGPSRAIVADEPVFFQIELKLKYGAEFKDTALFTAYQRYRSVMKYDTMRIYTRCCTAQISLERLAPSIQATILGVRVVKGEPFNYGCKVSCLFFPVDAMEGCAAEVVLLDCNGKRMHVGSDGYLPLSRNVVSVGLQGTLRVVIGGYSESEPSISQIGHVDFPVQQCQTSMRKCCVGGSEVKIVVAWSRLVMDNHDLVLDGY